MAARSGIMAAVSAPSTNAAAGGSGPSASERPVGVFDSGVGGLTVLHELLVRLPHEDFLYLGDTARFPYGERNADELGAFAIEIADLLLARGAKLLVVACNSAASAGLTALREHVAARAPEIEVVSVVGPEARLAVQTTRNGRIGLLATPATVASGAYEQAVRSTGEWARVVSVPCPDLAPIIQSGFPFDEHVVGIVRGYCRPLLEAGVDTVVLGCTHYPLVAPMLQRTLGPEVTLVSAGEAVARVVERALAARGLASPRAGEGDYGFLCTGDVAAFRELGTRFLQMPLGDVARVRFGAAPEAAEAVLRT
jgi:glutamate racemase